MRRKDRYDIRVRRHDFRVGQWVWYFYPRKYKNRSAKWQKMYTGPYLVTKVLPPANYVIQKSAKSKQFVVHADKLKLCFECSRTNWVLPDEDEGHVDVSYETQEGRPGESADDGRQQSIELTTADSHVEPSPRRARRKPSWLADYALA